MLSQCSACAVDGNGLKLVFNVPNISALCLYSDKLQLVMQLFKARQVWKLWRFISGSAQGVI